MVIEAQYLVEVRMTLQTEQEFWQIWASGTTQELISKKYSLEEQSQRYGRPYNLGELFIVEEEDLIEQVFGYGKWV